MSSVELQTLCALSGWHTFCVRRTAGRPSRKKYQKKNKEQLVFNEI